MYGFLGSALQASRVVIPPIQWDLKVVPWIVQCKTFVAMRGGPGLLSLISHYILMVYLNAYHLSCLWASRRRALYLNRIAVLLASSRSVFFLSVHS